MLWNIEYSLMGIYIHCCPIPLLTSNVISQSLAGFMELRYLNPRLPHRQPCVLLLSYSNTKPVYVTVFAVVILIKCVLNPVYTDLSVGLTASVLRE